MSQIGRPAKLKEVEDIDYRNNCQPFVACVREVKPGYTRPGHVAIFTLAETKQGSPKGMEFTEPEAFVSSTFDALDTDILRISAGESRSGRDRCELPNTALFAGDL
jgi:hypothetical protein